MKPLFIIVHERCIELDLLEPSALGNITPYFRAIEEIKTIKSRHEYVPVSGAPEDISYTIPTDREIIVCGAYREVCVKTHIESLMKKGVAAKMYEPATVSLQDCL